MNEAEPNEEKEETAEDEEVVEEARRASGRAGTLGAMLPDSGQTDTCTAITQTRLRKCL